MRFSEAKALLSVPSTEQPNVVELLGVLLSEDGKSITALVFELAEGGSLTHYITLLLSPGGR